MNDDSATSSATPPTPPGRDDYPELARRLDALGDATTLDVDAAWDTIQDRLETARPNGHRRLPPRLLLAAAAVLILLATAAIASTRGDDEGGDRVRMADHDDDHDDHDDSRDGRRERDTTTTVTSTAPPLPLNPGASETGLSGGGQPGRGSSGSSDDEAPAGGGGTTPSPDPDPSPSDPAIGPNTPLSRQGIGPIRSGMTLRQAAQVTGLPISAQSRQGTPCIDGWVDYSLGIELFFLAENVGGATADPMDGVIRTVVRGHPRTEAGLGIGDLASEFDQVYGPPTQFYPGSNPGSDVRIYGSGGYAYGITTDPNTGEVYWLESGHVDWVIRANLGICQVA